MAADREQVDLEQGRRVLDADVERVRAAFDELASCYAQAAQAVVELAAACGPTQARFRAQARALNAEAARRGLAPVCAAEFDMAAELDMALLTHGVTLPAGLTFSGMTRKGVDGV
jgi:hypothetical protein